MMIQTRGKVEKSEASDSIRWYQALAALTPEPPGPAVCHKAFDIEHLPFGRYKSGWQIKLCHKVCSRGHLHDCKVEHIQPMWKSLWASSPQVGMGVWGSRSGVRAAKAWCHRCFPRDMSHIHVVLLSIVLVLIHNNLHKTRGGREICSPEYSHKKTLQRMQSNRHVANYSCDFALC